MVLTPPIKHTVMTIRQPFPLHYHARPLITMAVNPSGTIGAVGGHGLPLFGLN